MDHGAELAQGVEGAQEHGLQLPLLPGVSRVVEQLARPVQRTGKLGASIVLKRQEILKHVERLNCIVG